MGIKQAVLAFAMLASASLPGTAGETWQPTKKQVDEFARVAQAQARDLLKDPDSGKFRNLFVSRHSFEEADGTRWDSLWLCGEVNAKNSYGGYIGFRRFAFAGKDAGPAGGLVIQEDDDSGGFKEIVWDRYCDKPVRSIR